MANEIKQIGIFERGDVIVPKDEHDIFLECTYDFALIRKIKGNPIGELGFGLLVYDASRVDFDRCSITELETWKRMVESGLLPDEVGYRHETPLKWLLRSNFEISIEVFDYLIQIYPDTDLSGMLPDIKRLDIAIWAYEHGADPNYSGYKYTVRKLMEFNRFIDSEDIYKYFFGENGVAVGT